MPLLHGPYWWVCEAVSRISTGAGAFALCTVSIDLNCSAGSESRPGKALTYKTGSGEAGHISRAAAYVHTVSATARSAVRPSCCDKARVPGQLVRGLGLVRHRAFRPAVRRTVFLRAQ